MAMRSGLKVIQVPQIHAPLRVMANHMQANEPIAGDELLYATAGPVARLTLNRPDKRNAQNLAMLAALGPALDRAANDPDVRVIVLSGAGSCFSAGHDIMENAQDPEVARQRASPEARLDLERRYYWAPAMALRDVPKPTIAQVHGHCIAGGLMLAAMCDIVVASEDALFSDPVLRMGANGLELPVELWAFGPWRARLVLLAGRSVDAETARAWGFVSEVVPPDRLVATVDALAAEIAAMPPEAARLTKASINRSLDLMGMTATFEQHFAMHQLAHATDESRRILEERKRNPDVRRYTRG
jgi:enoyl-CoA hydratase